MSLREEQRRARMLGQLEVWLPAFGLGYYRFQSPFGLDGLAKDDGERLDILAIHSFTPGRGQFRAFIAAAKHEYETICIWQVDNPWLHLVLLRYGFRAYSEPGERGKKVKGYRYDAGRGTQNARH